MHFVLGEMEVGSSIDRLQRQTGTPREVPPQLHVRIQPIARRQGSIFLNHAHNFNHFLHTEGDCAIPQVLLTLSAMEDRSLLIRGL